LGFNTSATFFMPVTFGNPKDSLPESNLRESRLRRRPLTVWILLKEGVQSFVDDNALTRGAAIAFYAVLAIAPVLFIASAVAALVLGQTATSRALHHDLTRYMSADSADVVQLAILRVRQGTHTIAGSLIGLGTLVLTASGFFAEVEDALNVIWRAPRHESYFYQLLRGRVMSLILVIGLGFLLLFSILVATAIRFLGQILSRYSDVSNLIIGIANLCLSYLIVSLLFAAIYKLLPNTRLLWRDVLVASLGTALLFEAGQTLIGYYLAHFITANIYGATGGIIVLLIWVYYSAQIFLLGAEFTKVWASHYGSLSKHE
jgi:membrane protein